MTLWQIEPLGPWTRPLTNPRSSSGRFRASWQDTLDKLLDEIVRLGLDGGIAIRLDVQAGDIRRDGMLRANAKVDFPGVVVSFTSPLHGPMSYATDAYEQVWAGDLPSWQANLRAIALSLEALRAVDRYGVTQSGEQYVGWRAIESSASPSGFASADDALRWVVAKADSGSDLGAGTAYKYAARKLHPDVGGDPAEWARLDEARRLLETAGVL